MTFANRIRKTIRNFYKTSLLERIYLSAFAGLSFALVGPFYTENDIGANFLDSFMSGFVYLFWMTVLLPVLHEKLTMRLVWDLAIIVVILVAGDMLYFGAYGFAKKSLLKAAIQEESSDYKRWVFFFSVVRICVIISALVHSSSSFLESKPKLKKSPKKSVKDSQLWVPFPTISPKKEK